MTASRRDTDRGSLLQSTMGSPQHRYPLRHKRKGADAGAEDGASGLHRRSRTPPVARSVSTQRERPLVSHVDRGNHSFLSRSVGFPRAPPRARRDGPPLSVLGANSRRATRLSTRHRAYLTARPCVPRACHARDRSRRAANGFVETFPNENATEKQAFDDAATRGAETEKTENTAAGCLHVCLSPLPDAKGKRKISFATVSKRAGGFLPTEPSVKTNGAAAERVGADTVSSKKHKRRRSSAPECGALGALPLEMLEEVLFRCGPRELGAMACVSKFFTQTRMVERVAKKRLDAHPRADGVVLGEETNSAKALLFVERADVALRTAAGLDLGAFHTAVLGVPGTFPRALSPPARRRTAARDFALRRGVGDEDFLRLSDGVSVDDTDELAETSASRYAWGPLPPVSPSAASRERERVAASQPRGRALYTFGRGFHGQLGQGGYDDAARPNVVSLAGVAGLADPSALETVRCGASHCAALSPDGVLLTWGLASSGELGHGGWTPIEVDAPRAVASMAAVKVAQVAAGANHTVAVSETGGLWTCGRGRHGQLGHGHFHDAGPLRRLDAMRGMRVTHAVAGGAHSVCLTEDGLVWSWGACRHGQLGLGDVAFAVAAGWETGVPWPCLVESLQDIDEPVVTLAAGGHHTLLVTAGGQLWGCGRGEHGALGVGVRGGNADYYYYEEDQRGAVRGPRDHLVPRLIPVHHKPAPKAARFRPGGMRRTGSGSLAEATGGVGPASAFERASPFPREGSLPLLFAAATLTATTRNKKKKRNRRSMRASCGGPAASLRSAPAETRGDASAPPPFPGRGGWVKAPCSCGATCRVALAAAGGSHSAVLTACGAVMTTGSNAYGQLGLGDVRRRYAFERVEALRGSHVATVSVGEDHSGAVAEDGRLFLWGRGDWGQLGTGDARSHFTPRLVEGVSVAPPVAPERFLGFRGGRAGAAAEESDDDEDPLREMGGRNQHAVASPRAAAAY